VQRIRRFRTSGRLGSDRRTPFHSAPRTDAYRPARNTPALYLHVFEAGLFQKRSNFIGSVMSVNVFWKDCACLLISRPESKNKPCTGLQDTSNLPQILGWIRPEVDGVESREMFRRGINQVLRTACNSSGGILSCRRQHAYVLSPRTSPRETAPTSRWLAYTNSYVTVVAQFRQNCL
jgi:hypothetical protein